MSFSCRNFTLWALNDSLCQWCQRCAVTLSAGVAAVYLLIFRAAVTVWISSGLEFCTACTCLVDCDTFVIVIVQLLSLEFFTACTCLAYGDSFVIVRVWLLSLQEDLSFLMGKN